MSASSGRLIVTAIACLALAASLLAGSPAAIAKRPPSPDIDLSAADRCDFIGQQQGSRCLLPFPDDYYTVADPRTATGRRLNLQTASMPANAGAASTSPPAPYNASDGFSPGSTIVLKVPGLDSTAALAGRARCRSTTSAATATPDQPIVVIDADTGQRWPIWAEIDANAGVAAADRPADPSRDELRLGSPLHRRAAKPEDRQRGHDRGARRLPLLPRPAARRSSR